MNPTLGEWLKNGRTEKGLTIKEVQAKAQASGLAKMLDISKYEHNRLNPNGHLNFLCDVYGLSSEEAPAFVKDANYKPKRRRSPQRRAACGNVKVAPEVAARLANRPSQPDYKAMLRQALEAGDCELGLVLLDRI